MIKRYLLFCQLSLVPGLTAQAQFSAGSEGVFVASDTQIAIDGLTLRPSSDFALTSRSLSISDTPVPGSPASIARVYNFSAPIDFAGNVGFFYLASELNGNAESSLQLAYGNTDFVTTTGSTVLPAQGYVSNNLPVLTNFSSVTAGQEGALPVTLAGFQLQRVENLTTLYWQTSEEKNSAYFDIQHSTNARNWQVLGRVEAAGDRAKDYSFQDPALRNGRQYYRLKMVDADGSYAFSSIKSLDLGFSELVSIYPNPVTDKLLIKTATDIASLKLIDLSGKPLVELARPGSGQWISMKSYPAGTYLVRVKLADGSDQVMKVIKQ